jgi:transposase-like protein
MPAERTPMRQMREILRLKFVGDVSIREIARRVGVAASTVRTTIKRFQAAGQTWPLPEEMTDAALEARLFATAGIKQGHRRQAEPDWAEIHRELKRKHVTLSLLWDEYIERNPEGYRYSRFCELYRNWEGKLSVTMRQTHVGGDKLFVDYAGDTVPVIVDRLTGEHFAGRSGLQPSKYLHVTRQVLVFLLINLSWASPASLACFNIHPACRFSLPEIYSSALLNEPHAIVRDFNATLATVPA